MVCYGAHQRRGSENSHRDSGEGDTELQEPTEMTKLSKQALKIIAEYRRELSVKGGLASKGTEAAKIRSAKANAAKKAKREKAQ